MTSKKEKKHCPESISIRWCCIDNDPGHKTDEILKTIETKQVPQKLDKIRKRKGYNSPMSVGRTIRNSSKAWPSISTSPIDRLVHGTFWTRSWRIMRWQATWWPPHNLIESSRWRRMYWSRCHYMFEWKNQFRRRAMVFWSAIFFKFFFFARRLAGHQQVISPVFWWGFLFSWSIMIFFICDKSSCIKQERWWKTPKDEMS